MTKKTLVVVSYGYGTENPFYDLFKRIKYTSKRDPAILTKGDVVLFEGGTDINPSLYGQEAGSYTGFSDEQRDEFEVSVFNEAKKLGIPMLGICRGAQFLCAMSGGKLAQHVNKHGRDHLVTDNVGDTYPVTSTHHQMMLPKGTNHELVAYAKEATIHLGEKDIPLDVETDAEVVYFKDTKALAIQGHPEYLHSHEQMVVKCREYGKDYLLK